MSGRIRPGVAAVGLLAWLAAVAGRAAAHGGHAHGVSGGETGAGAALPAALFLGGVLVLGTSVYLDHADMLENRLADVGVLVGVVGLLAGVTLAFV